jgi:hypothetical protein
MSRQEHSGSALQRERAPNRTPMQIDHRARACILA